MKFLLVLIVRRILSQKFAKHIFLIIERLVLNFFNIIFLISYIIFGGKLLTKYDIQFGKYYVSNTNFLG